MIMGGIKKINEIDLSKKKKKGEFETEGLTRRGLG